MHAYHKSHEFLNGFFDIFFLSALRVAFIAMYTSINNILYIQFKIALRSQAIKKETTHNSQHLN